VIDKFISVVAAAVVRCVGVDAQLMTRVNRELTLVHVYTHTERDIHVAHLLITFSRDTRHFITVARST